MLPPQQPLSPAFAMLAQHAAPGLQQVAPDLQQSAFTTVSWPQQDAPSLQQELPCLQHDSAFLPWQHVPPSLQQAAPFSQQVALAWEPAGLSEAAGAAVCAHMLMANNNVTSSVRIFMESSILRWVSCETVHCN
jgi:hypothetical protein